MQLLAVSGPFHYWGPVVDGQYLRQAPATALQKPPRAKVDLLIGSSQDDGLINRAKAVKVGGSRPPRPCCARSSQSHLGQEHRLTCSFTKQLLKNYDAQSLHKGLGRQRGARRTLSGVDGLSRTPHLWMSPCGKRRAEADRRARYLQGSRARIPLSHAGRLSH